MTVEEALREINEQIRAVVLPADVDCKTLMPSKLRVQCGNLEIVGDSGSPGRQAIAGWRVRAFKDGEPFAFKRLVLTVDVHGVVTVDASFYPKGAGEPSDQKPTDEPSERNDPIPGQYVCEKCGHRMNLGSGDEKKCGACGSEFVRKRRRVGDDEPQAIITPKQ